MPKELLYAFFSELHGDFFLFTKPFCVSWHRTMYTTQGTNCLWITQNNKLSIALYWTVKAYNKKKPKLTFQVGTAIKKKAEQFKPFFNLNPSFIDVYVHCMVCNITIAYWEISTGRRDGEYPGCHKPPLLLVRSKKVKGEDEWVTLKCSYHYLILSSKYSIFISATKHWNK